MMMNFQSLLFIFIGFWLNGCSRFDKVNIQNIPLRERVIACSAGFSQDTTVALIAAHDSHNEDNQLSLGFKKSAQSAIFSDVLGQDRLKAYEDYLGCVEQFWNKQSAESNF